MGKYAAFTVGNVRNTVRRILSYSSDIDSLIEPGDSKSEFNYVSEVLRDIIINVLEKGLHGVAELSDKHRFPADEAEDITNDYLEAKKILKYNWK